ncbi:MAG: acyl dehydratase [Halieaceae bacterium]|jgi:hydroxyacyl-ACP dehydratase HTD2-like protein with hotdog domain|nr:acyl dehydratase [Halieaceae bacterium]
MSKNIQRFIEDIEVGMELEPTFNTPTTTQLFNYSAVSRNGHRIHYEEKFAHGDRLPAVLVQGPLQGAQLSAYICDWMGDAGFVKKYGFSCRGIAMPGETLTIKGRVKRTFEEDGNHAVELEVWEENGEGEKLVPATATVYLPSRAAQ